MAKGQGGINMFNIKEISITNSQAQEIIVMNNEEALKVISILTQNSSKYLEELLKTPIKELNDLREFIEVFGFNFDILMNFLNRINRKNIENIAYFSELCEILGLEIRICDKCDSFMVEGYHIDGGYYYCSDECLYGDFTEDEVNHLLEAEDEYNYYTEWTEGENTKFNIKNINYNQLYESKENFYGNSSVSLNNNEFNVLKALLFSHCKGEKKLFLKTIKNSFVIKKLFSDYSNKDVQAKKELYKLNNNLKRLGLIDNETEIYSIDDLEKLYNMNEPMDCLSEEVFENSIYSFICKRLDNLDILKNLWDKKKSILEFWDIIDENCKILKKQSYYEKIIDIILVNFL